MKSVKVLSLLLMVLFSFSCDLFNYEEENFSFAGIVWDSKEYPYGNSCDFVAIKYENNKAKITTWYDNEDLVFQENEAVVVELNAKYENNKLYLEDESGEYVHCFTISDLKENSVKINDEKNAFFEGQRLFSKVK